MSVVFDDQPGKVVFDDEQPKMGGKPPLGWVAKQVFGELPQVKAISSMVKNPQTMLPALGAGIGTALAPGLGTAAGAGLGQIGSRMIDIAKGSPVQSPGKEAIGPMVQAFAGGIPEVSGVFNPGTSTIAQKVGGGLAKMGETMSGAKKDILQQGARQGMSTYGAPSLKKAQEVFGAVLGPEGREAVKTTASQAFDPALSQARDFATKVGTQIENGASVNPIDALKARQATDRVISSTPFWDKKAREALFDWRTKFDDVMTSQRGDLKEASNLYRKAIVKDMLLSPTRLTKHGAPSAFLPLLMGAAGPVMGMSQGHAGKGALGALGGLAATSPAVWGLGATALGSINPALAQSGIAALIQRMMSDNKSAQ